MITTPDGVDLPESVNNFLLSERGKERISHEKEGDIYYWEWHTEVVHRHFSRLEDLFMRECFEFTKEVKDRELWMADNEQEAEELIPNYRYY